MISINSNVKIMVNIESVCSESDVYVLIVCACFLNEE